MNRTVHRRPSLPTRVWAWAVAAMFLLQVAVPLLAATAASQRGVSVVEVCSAYGVRTVQLDSAPAGDPSAPMSGHHAGAFDCALTPLLGGAALANPPSVVLHAPAVALATPLATPGPLPVDANRRWLAGRLHAPPFSI
jgi:hypothetical protein